MGVDDVDTVVTTEGEEFKFQEQDGKYAVELDLESLNDVAQETYGLLMRRGGLAQSVRKCTIR